MIQDSSPPFRINKEGVELFIRCTPNASKNQINGLTIDANGRQYIKIHVNAVPENNKANDAIIQLLSKQFDIPKSCITQTSGHTQRLKIFLLEGISIFEVEIILNKIS